MHDNYNDDIKLYLLCFLALYSLYAVVTMLLPWQQMQYVDLLILEQIATTA